MNEIAIDREKLVARFEAEMAKVDRPGMDGLMNYIRKSDFYTAPASTKYHLSCEGGLLQHSINVLDALRTVLTPTDHGTWEYRVAGNTVAEVPDESLIMTALLHDLCKANFYATSLRNAKNEQTGKWEKVPYYTVNDRMPLGHGPKSAMLAKNFTTLTNTEMYCIWWHMGFTMDDSKTDLTNALDLYPIIWAVHTADMMASHMMEGKTGNKQGFQTHLPADPEPEYADNGAPDYGDEPVFQEAAPLA